MSVSTRSAAARLEPAASWRPTTAHLRAALSAAVLVAVALIWRRADLLVIATPMAIVAIWSVAVRPESAPTFEDRLGHSTIREGDATTWHGSVRGPGIDVAAAAMGDGRWFERRPPEGSVTAVGDPDGADLAIGVRSIRWGHRLVEPVTVVAAGAWGAFQWSTVAPRHPLTALPRTSMFDTSAPIRPTNGLVGPYRSVRQGEGSEFAGIRPFHSGDRMRRINWPRSLRSTGLHVNSTWADQDTHVALLVDAGGDFGVSGGIDGAASSLDITVRAAAAIAEHHVRRGDRVSLQVFGATASHAVPPATGQAQLRRILDTLVFVRPVSDLGARPRTRARQIPVGGEALTVMLSPLIAPEALDRAVSLGRHGVSVVVVDVLADDVIVDADDPTTELAWRIRLLERRRELRTVQQAGIAVVRWLGAGSLDRFLRDVARRAHAPRMRRR